MLTSNFYNNKIYAYFILYLYKVENESCFHKEWYDIYIWNSLEKDNENNIFIIYQTIKQIKIFYS